jgi:TonB family protein
MSLRRLFCLLACIGIAGCVQPQRMPPAMGYPASGTAEALLDVDYESGRITAVHILKSTGNAKLDAATIRRLSQWRTRPRTYKHIKVPITFNVKTGSSYSR